MEGRGKPVYVFRRTKEAKESVAKFPGEKIKDSDSLAANQPSYVSGFARTQPGKEEYLVLVGLCTHLGCAPISRPDVGAKDLGGDSLLGGIFFPCHGS